MLLGHLKRASVEGRTEAVNEALAYLKELQGTQLSKPAFTDKHSVWKLAEPQAKVVEDTTPTPINGVERVAPSQVTVTKQKPFGEMNTEELVSYVKSEGKEVQASYGSFVKYRNLKPEINAKRVHPYLGSGVCK